MRMKISVRIGNHAFTGNEKLNYSIVYFMYNLQRQR
ncbi:Protein of unknown function [Pyronema omphalodes CBS 100304]|uniref:Uncharacterized protein n=1 Tax=Pyronema omphalodes (strain CBS 100304) TaxID=1076935 RepID=U4LBY3_PYROM|nr:Protein of unknown function [Pyronema omphalodes CBS 100304]